MYVPSGPVAVPLPPQQLYRSADTHALATGPPIESVTIPERLPPPPSEKSMFAVVRPSATVTRAAADQSVVLL